MEIKKSPKADLENKKGLLLQIGLIIALLAVIGAFLYTEQRRIEQIEVEAAVVETEMVEITKPKETPPPPKKVEVKAIADILEVVTNDANIETDISFEDFDDDLVIEAAPVEEEEIVEDEVFVKVEVMPTFQGGDEKKFHAWVQQNVKYPDIALDNGISGAVVVRFTVEKDGSLGNIEVLRSPDRSLSEEAIRVLKKSPKWTPGKQRNKPVRVTFTIPVMFRIQN